MARPVLWHDRVFLCCWQSVGPINCRGIAGVQWFAAVLLANSGFAMAWTGMGLLVSLIVIWSLTDGARLEFAATQSMPESVQRLARDA